MENVFRDFRYAIRSLRKDKKFAFVAVFALALGIGASTVVFSVFYNLLFNAITAKDAARLVVPVLENPEQPNYRAGTHQLFLQWADLKYVREHNQVFEQVVGSHNGIEDRGEVFWVFGPLSDYFDQLTYATPEFGVSLSAPLAGIALLLVVVGVFSMMAYTVALRTQEVGVRMALGAQRGDVLRMVLRHGLALISAGLAIGLLASFGLTRFLASQIWGVSPTAPCTFGCVALVLVMAGLLACYLPARRATEVNPLVALRYE